MRNMPPAHKFAKFLAIWNNAVPLNWEVMWMPALNVVPYVSATTAAATGIAPNVREWNVSYGYKPARKTCFR